MKKFWKQVKQRWYSVSVTLLLVAVLVVGGVVVDIPRLGQLIDDVWTITVGTEAHAAGSVDYVTDGTDDQVQINTAITAVNATGGGRVLVLSGTYSYSGQIIMASNTQLVGASINATIFERDTVAAPTLYEAITNDDYTNGNVNIVLKDFTIDGKFALGLAKTTDNGNIDLYNVEDCQVIRVQSLNSRMECFQLGNARRVLYDSCIANGSNDDGFSATDGTNKHKTAQSDNLTRDITYINCFSTNNCDAGFELDDGPRRVTYIGCTTTNSTPAKGFVIHGHASSSPVENVRYISCKSIHRGAVAWAIQGLDDFSDNVTDVELIGCYADGQVNVRDAVGVKITGGYYTNYNSIYAFTSSCIVTLRNIQGLIIKDATFNEVGGWAIYMLAETGYDVDGVLIDGVSFLDYTRGIYLHPNAADVSFTGITVRDVYMAKPPSDANQLIWVDNDGAVTDLIIESNRASVTSGVRFVLFDADTGHTTTAWVRDNIMVGFSTPVAYTGSGTNTVTCRQNVGWVTENSGTGSITSGVTTDVITHGLNITPTVAKIHIQGAEDPTNSTGNTWITSANTTSFTVNCENDPGATNWDFTWNYIE